MKCIHCGSEWSSTTSVTKCPFCGKPLSESTQKNKTLTSTLVEIRKLSGIQALSNGKALVSSFKDLAPMLKKEYTMLSYLEKCCGVAELFKAKDKTLAEQESAVAKVVRRMADELMVSESAAQTVCHAYMLVVSGKENETPKPATPSAVAPVQTKPAASVPRFQIDAGGKLLKYSGPAGVITVPNNVKVIGARAFERNQTITHVRLPEGLLGIEEYAFAVCQKLESITFPSTLRSIGNKSFWACNALKEVTIPGGAGSLADLAFWGCKGLTKVTLQEGITELDAHIFDSCSEIREIHLPKSLKKVHIYAFTGAVNARVYGNLAWTVKDGHVVANQEKSAAYHNKGDDAQVSCE